MAKHAKPCPCEDREIDRLTADRAAARAEVARIALLTQERVLSRGLNEDVSRLTAELAALREAVDELVTAADVCYAPSEYSNNEAYAWSRGVIHAYQRTLAALTPASEPDSKEDK